MSKTVYITEQQEQAIIDRYLSESLVVNSNQVSDIVNYLNNHYQTTTDVVGDTDTNGLAKATLGINYIVNGQPVQKLKPEELVTLLVNEPRFKRFVKDDVSRTAYFYKIVDEWLRKCVKLTGQLSVNVIDDEFISRFKKATDKLNNNKKSEKKDDDKKEKKDSE